MPKKHPSTPKTVVVDTFNHEPMHFRFEFLAAGVKSGHGMDGQPHRHPVYELFFFVAGGGQHDVDFVQMPIAPGMLHWVKPGQVHFLSRDQACAGFVVQFDAAFFTDARDRQWFEGLWMHQQAIAGSQALLLDDMAVHEATGFMETWRRYGSGVDTLALDRMRLRLLLTQAERCFYHQYHHKPTVHGGMAGLLHRFQQLVEQHFYREHRLSFYTERLHCSPQVLLRETKWLLNKTPSQLLHERLLVEAKSMFMFTELSSKEIAFALGFEDPAYFGRFFKKQTGKTPDQMRKQLREKYQ